MIPMTPQAQREISKLRGKISERAYIVFKDHGEVDHICQMISLPFDEYSEAIEELGEKRCHGMYGITDEEKKTVWHARTYDEPNIMLAALALRYPFILPRNDDGSIAWDGAMDFLHKPSENVSEFELSFTESLLHYMSRGWRARFGLEYCEDCLDILSSSSDGDEIREATIQNSKNKLGTWRAYFTMPSDVQKFHGLISSLYMKLSEFTCESCGSFFLVRMTQSGYITPLCDKHMRSRMGNELIENSRKKLLEKHPDMSFEDLDLLSSQYAAENNTGVACVDTSKIECCDDYIENRTDGNPAENYLFASCGYKSYDRKIEDYPVPWEKTRIRSLFEECFKYTLDSRSDVIERAFGAGFDIPEMEKALCRITLNGGRPFVRARSYY